MSLAERAAIAAREQKVAAQLDGHYCYDWDEMAVSAWTPEYQACGCYPKTWRGRLANWLFMRWFNYQERKARQKAEDDFYYPWGT